MGEDREAFLSRWSRRKREAPAKAANEKAALEEKKALDALPAPTLPPVEALTPESDFRDFMHPKVDDALRRVALKKMFADPHFQLPDLFEPFSGDWTSAEPISPELLATLNQVRTVLFPEQEKKAEDEPPKGEAKQDEPGKQDA